MNSWSCRAGRRARTLLGLAACAGISAGAGAQTVSTCDFETARGPWLVNGNETLVNDGNGPTGQYIVLPDGDFWGVTLSSDQTSTGLTGDITRHGAALRVSFDIRTFRFDNFFGEPIDPNSRPLILHLHDRGDPNDFSDDAGVWISTTAIPATEDGWQRREFTIPLPVGGEMPAGWGGTGGEDPVTFEPTLPPGRTYASVLASVDEVEISTFQPGYFYTFCFWHIGFDNVLVEQIGAPSCPCDWNDQGGLSVQDIFDFLSSYFAGDGDFNGTNGTTVQDIFDFLSCYFTGC